MKKYRAFALFSGGLDSILSTKYMLKLGYDILPIFFKTVFFGPEKAIEIAESNGLKLIVKDITEIYLKMLLNPKYGYGKNMNPCIDCHGLMFQEAGKLMPDYQVDFLISGEVLGQRPKSQRSDALNSVANLSQVRELIIRPLSQKLLPDTKPIKAGWVEKDDLLDIQGRSRARQMHLAKELGVKNYLTPGGGCLLTDANFTQRLQDLLKYKMFTLKNIKFLKYGRHFRLSENTKLIVGRNKQDNDEIANLITDEITLLTKGVPGPLAVLRSHHKLQDIEITRAAGILLRYNNKANPIHPVLIKQHHKVIDEKKVKKFSDKETKEFII